MAVPGNYLSGNIGSLGGSPSNGPMIANPIIDYAPPMGGMRSATPDKGQNQTQGNMPQPWIPSLAGTLGAASAYGGFNPSQMGPDTKGFSTVSPWEQILAALMAGGGRGY